MSDSVEPDVASALQRARTTFMGVELFVEPGVLVPREETELLGREAVRLLSAIPGEQRFIDLCTGAGNLACTIARQVETARGWAADLTESCVRLAARNVMELGLAPRVEVVQGDLFAPLDADGLRETIDVIVCNPPYISTSRLKGDRASLLEHEPREAFDGGPYGLSIHQRVIRDALPFLKRGGRLLFEFGLGQERQMKALFDRTRAYGELRFVEDAASAPRVVVATKL